MLPEGWDTYELGDLAEFKSGGTPSKQNDSFWGGAFPWVSAKDLKSHYITKAELGLTASGELQANVAPVESILVLVRGMTLLKDVPIGLVKRRVAFNQDIKALIANANVDPIFLSYFLVLQKKTMMALVNIANHGTGRLDTDLLRGLSVLLPPLPEQRKIAEILSTWDAAIGAQERLIANARAQKKALMQTLLPTNAHPPKKRLPGFSGAWRSVCLGDVGKLRKGKGIQRDQVRASGFPCIRYGEIYTQHHEQVRQFHSFIDSETAAESEPILAGDILFTCSGETAEEIGKCVAFLGHEKAYAGGDIIILSPTTDNAAFLSYVLNGTDVTEQKRRFGQGNSVVHISATNLAKLTFMLPDRAEQDAIARILDVATDHIGGLEAALATLAQEKSALMQQLLTGKRRVLVGERETAE